LDYSYNEQRIVPVSMQKCKAYNTHDSGVTTAPVDTTTQGDEGRGALVPTPN